MAKRAYGQFCGIARALDLVGERWALLIVRDLLGNPKRFGELQRGLKSIPTNILTVRLRELEQNGVIQRRRSSSVTVYELTAFGRELEDILLRLGRWGAQTLPVPEDGPGYIDPAIRALQRAFRPEPATDWSCRVELAFGQFTIHANVQSGSAVVGEGSLSNPDLFVDVRGSLIPVLNGQVPLDTALDDGRIRFIGDRAQLERFLLVFAMSS
jgi:DNA-binding HxlR family transcriptional regulator